MNNYINNLISIFNDLLPQWEVYFYDKPLMNVVADTIEGRYYKPILANNFLNIVTNKTATPIVNQKQFNPLFIFIEEPTIGEINYNTRGLPYLQYQISIYFCTLVEMENEALERQTIREDIINEAILPFINKYNDFMSQPYRIEQPKAEFDANEVSVKLTIDFMLPLCGL